MVSTWKILENLGNLDRLWQRLAGTGGGHRSQLVSESHVIVHHRKESKSHELDLRTPRCCRNLVIPGAL